MHCMYEYDPKSRDLQELILPYEILKLLEKNPSFFWLPFQRKLNLLKVTYISMTLSASLHIYSITPRSDKQILVDGFRLI